MNFIASSMTVSARVDARALAQIAKYCMQAGQRAATRSGLVAQAVKLVAENIVQYDPALATPTLEQAYIELSQMGLAPMSRQALIQMSKGLAVENLMLNNDGMMDVKALNKMVGRGYAGQGYAGQDLQEKVSEEMSRLTHQAQQVPQPVEQSVEIPGVMCEADRVEFDKRMRDLDNKDQIARALSMADENGKIDTSGQGKKPVETRTLEQHLAGYDEQLVEWKVEELLRHPSNRQKPGWFQRQIIKTYDQVGQPFATPEQAQAKAAELTVRAKAIAKDVDVEKLVAEREALLAEQEARHKPATVAAVEQPATGTTQALDANSPEFMAQYVEREKAKLAALKAGLKAGMAG